MPQDAGAPYKLIFFQNAREQVRLWAEKAARLGMARPFAATLRTLQHKLTVEPLTWGDPQYHYRQLGLLVYRGYQDLLYVHYAVDEPRRIVYVKNVKLQPGHPLNQEP
jgi:hypothetical protein